jgi:hypothetical protein
MSAAAEALRVARAAGVAVTSDGHHLSVAAPVQPPAAVLELLRQHKPAIVELLQHDVSAWTDAVTTRLDPELPAPDVPPQRWAQFVADCYTFVESEWGEKAATFAWDARQLFGCHRDRPNVRQWWGAVWLLKGGQIVAMEADTIYIETAGGVRQTIRKMDHRYDFIVPVWEATDERE